MAAPPNASRQFSRRPAHRCLHPSGPWQREMRRVLRLFSIPAAQLLCHTRFGALPAWLAASPMVSPCSRGGGGQPGALSGPAVFPSPASGAGWGWLGRPRQEPDPVSRLCSSPASHLTLGPPRLAGSDASAAHTCSVMSVISPCWDPELGNNRRWFPPDSETLGEHPSKALALASPTRSFSPMVCSAGA